MNLGYKLTYHRDAVKFISKLESAVQERIAQGLSNLLNDPPTGDIKRMKGYIGLYRLRIGTLRVLFEISHSEKIVYITYIQIGSKPCMPASGGNFLSAKVEYLRVKNQSQKQKKRKK